MQIVASNDTNGFKVVHLTCPRCGLPSGAALLPGIGNWNDLLKSGRDVTDARWTVSRFWPETPAPNVPEYLPPDVERVYLQAERNFPVEGNEEASGIMYRKALDVSLKKIDPALAGMLGQKIKKLAASGKLTKEIAEWSDSIRDIGNDAAHEEAPISRDELEDLRNFSEMVLRYLFSLPGAVMLRRGEIVPWL
ncbi:MAG: DUF4145 domain-containing protein [Rhizomicrobium sp.]